MSLMVTNTQRNMSTQQLIDNLQQIVSNNIKEANKFQECAYNKLNKKPAPKSWSVLECVEHINRYDKLYLSRVDKSINSAEKIDTTDFKSGLIGGVFANLIHPDKKGLKTKTLPSMNPSNSDLSKEVINVFIDQQLELYRLLKNAQEVDLSRIKIASSVTNLLSFNLGDTFKILVYHDLRHIRQAKNALDRSSSNR